ncbi:non-hydrolyzing UDP-N-acetylglucosamine 2-epimerase [Desulfomonile tiedjei]|uniref:UDP-N-acetylglucosamine 2-epimerase n=1 Tax=Desulfomonile tiedjei (strain ATCC 49306 / DSM 6799 / DCB-1) TaxID=706587 RepID=I4C283_DESTA|nr:UDP-N-acetylglucosamine 2-epimerase (non-hydrolyzing) [Desulfomonile tiedjei]AFM23674.1 UDP-N-acetylglucosamine 2-epimerase [Desulfomonile tiedjei DSM 6799]
MQKKIVSVVGARPNFMKIAPLEREFKKYPDIRHMVVHTGQHYDREMSGVFFEQLGLSHPERDLGVGSGGHGEMTGKIMIEFEKACLELQPDMVVVVGDVNSTIAASLVARKLSIPVAHVESGLRSFDETMPEELNRRLTDCLSNLLFVSEPAGMQNLEREGIDMIRAHLVGDIMLETIQMFFPAISNRKRWEDFNLQPGKYALITLHRPSNVDSEQALREVVDILSVIDMPILFPIHPRTLKRLREAGLESTLTSKAGLIITEPQPYIEFLSLLQGATLALSDSGSVQSEAAFFDVPCLVARENTERPIYLEQGTTTLVGRNKERIGELVTDVLEKHYPHATEIVKELSTDVGAKTVKIIAENLI